MLGVSELGLATVRGGKEQRGRGFQVTDLDLKGTSGQPASHGMDKLVRILSNDIQGVELLGVSEGSI